MSTNNEQYFFPILKKRSLFTNFVSKSIEFVDSLG